MGGRWTGVLMRYKTCRNARAAPRVDTFGLAVLGLLQLAFESFNVFFHTNPLMQLEGAV